MIKNKGKGEIVSEALADMEFLKNALNANTKGILKQIAVEEIDNVLRESLNEDDYEEVDADESDEDADVSVSDEDSVGDADMDTEVDADVDVDAEVDAAVDVDVDSDLSDDADFGDGEIDLGGDEIDVSTSDDEAAISVYKELSDGDEIEVIGDEIHINITEPGKYVLKPKELTSVSTDVSGDVDEFSDTDEFGVEDDVDAFDEEVMYEIHMDADDEVIDESDEAEEVVKEDEIKESIPVGLAQSKHVPAKNTQIRGAGAANMKETTSNQYEKMLAEYRKMKSENDKLKDNLVKFRHMLAETVVFNSNLSNVTRIFLEHSTTKDEKKSIIRRFDEEVKSIKESKTLYSKIVNELSTRMPIIENHSGFDKPKTSGSSNLNEKNVYVDDESQKIIKLMERLEGKKLIK